MPDEVASLCNGGDIRPLVAQDPFEYVSDLAGTIGDDQQPVLEAAARCSDVEAAVCRGLRDDDQLRWSDVDLDAGRLRVVQTIIQVRSKVTIGEPKTARGRRPIALDAGTVAVLREHRRQSLEERMLVGPDFEDRGLVFHYPDGTCLRPDAVSATFERRVRKAGSPPLTLKGLRHTWATLALERGIHPRVVQERLGHSTIAITLGIYSHVAPTLHDEAAQLIADLLLDR